MTETFHYKRPAQYDTLPVMVIAKRSRMHQRIAGPTCRYYGRKTAVYLVAHPTLYRFSDWSASGSNKTKPAQAANKEPSLYRFWA